MSRWARGSLEGEVRPSAPQEAERGPDLAVAGGEGRGVERHHERLDRLAFVGEAGRPVVERLDLLVGQGALDEEVLERLVGAAARGHHAVARVERDELFLGHLDAELFFDLTGRLARERAGVHDAGGELVDLAVRVDALLVDEDGALLAGLATGQDEEHRGRVAAQHAAAGERVRLVVRERDELAGDVDHLGVDVEQPDLGAEHGRTEDGDGVDAAALLLVAVEVGHPRRERWERPHLLLGEAGHEDVEREFAEFCHWGILLSFL